MATLNTSNQQLPYPDSNEYIKFAWQQIRDALLAVEPKLVMKFSSASDLSTRVPSPTEGMLAYVSDVDVLQLYVSGAWKRVYPPAPTIYTGTTTPSGSLGSVGDIYVQY